MDLKAIEKIYVKQLKEIYSAEKQILEILPKVIRVARNKDFKAIFKKHFEETKLQAGRIQNTFQHFNHYKPTGENCDSIEGMLDELDDLINEHDPKTLDAEMLLIFQKIEHFEIACYSSVITYARILGHDQAGELLQESLDEEYETDNKLDKLNEAIINNLLMKHA